MIVLFIIAYFAIYIYYFRLDRELGIRKMPTLFTEESLNLDVESVNIKLFAKQMLLPLLIIAVAVIGVYFIFSTFSLPVLILGTYIFSFISRRKIREINYFDEKFKDGDNYDR